jgi:hypothetical protein
MRKRLLFPVMSISMLAGILMLASSVPGEQKYVPREKSNLASEDANGYMQWLISRRANPLTGSVDMGDVALAHQQADAMAGNRAVGLVWEEMGPNNVGGRTRAFLIDKFNNNHLYAGGVGGGLWYSTNAGGSWQRINGGDAMASLSVASICQSSDGYIYFGTGEGLYTFFGDGTGGLQGKGIFKSTSPSNSSSPALDYVSLSSTVPAAQTSPFIAINKMAASINNPQRIYAATYRGLYLTDDGGANWVNAAGSTGSAKDVDVASDGTVLAAVNNRGYRSATGDVGSYTILSGGLPISGLDRIEFAFAPSDPNYVYACAVKSNGELQAVYKSINKGDNWQNIGPGVSGIFNPHNNQGGYNNALAVAPDNKDKIIVGGVELWDWQLTNGWREIDCAGCWEQSVYYTHADKHNVTFDPVNPNIMYVASDGGIAKSYNQGTTYTRINKNYNVTQFYSVAVDPLGNPMGGTQDNGTQYITGRYVVSASNPNDTILNDPQYAHHVMGGDGAFTAFSYLYPPSYSPVINQDAGAAFASTQYANIRRSNGTSWQEFYDSHIDYGTDPNNPTYSGSFVTPFRLWESRNDLLTHDSVTFAVPDSLVQVMVAEIVASTSRKVSGSINYNYLFQSSGHIDSIVPGSVFITDGIQVAVDDGNGHFVGDVSTSPNDSNYIHYGDRTFDMTFNSPLAIDSALTIYYKVRYPSGAVINVNSATANLPIAYTLSAPLASGSSVTIQDIIQARFVVGLTAPGGNCIWLTKRSLDFSTSDPPWIKIASGLSGSPECMVFSNDGNHLFVGTSGGRVYRISGLSQVKDSLTGWVGSSGNVLTVTMSTTAITGSVIGIDISKSNPNKVFAVCGGYGTANHVFRSTNALSGFTFLNVQNGLPAMPVYDVMINRNNDNIIVLGTDLGVYASDDNGTTWNEENLGIARTATVMVRQQENNWYGMPDHRVYAATHGRGIFRTGSLVGIDDELGSTLGEIDSRAVKVYPNPMTQNGFADFVLNKSAEVSIEFYDIKGTLLKTDKLGKRASGLHRYSFDAGNLKNGTYFLVVRAGTEKATGRFVIVK